MSVDWTGPSPQVKRCDKQHAVIYQGRHVHWRAFDVPRRIPNTDGVFRAIEVICPARYGRQRRAAGGVRGARAHRLPHDRLHVRRAGDDAPGQGQRGRRRRQHRRVDRRLLPRPLALHLCRLHLRRVGPARPWADGLDGNSHMFANMASHSVEVTEAEQPLQLLAYEFVADKAGAGKYRGGVPFRRDYRFLEDEGVLQVRSDRRTHGRSACTGAARAGPPRTTSIPTPRPARCPASSP